jgi:hypothetical protein
LASLSPSPPSLSLAPSPSPSQAQTTQATETSTPPPPTRVQTASHYQEAEEGHQAEQAEGKVSSRLYRYRGRFLVRSGYAGFSVLVLLEFEFGFDFGDFGIGVVLEESHGGVVENGKGV